MSTFAYKSFGLVIDVPFECPELVAANGAVPDVVVRYGDVPESIPDARSRGTKFQVAPGKFLLNLPRIGRYYVTDGTDIVIERDAESDERDVRVFLLASAMTALVQQRGMVTLHASCVDVGGGAVMFLGKSGAGKSTLAMAFSEKGYRLHTDDVCVIRADGDGPPMVMPQFPQLKLWRDAVEAFDQSPDDLRRIRRKVEKYSYIVEGGVSAEPLPARALYFLDSHNRETLDVHAVKGPAAIEEILKNTYRKNYVMQEDARLEHFRVCSGLAKHCRIMSVTRPQRKCPARTLADALEKDFS